MDPTGRGALAGLCNADAAAPQADAAAAGRVTWHAAATGLVDAATART